jgi:hypothetical protein
MARTVSLLTAVVALTFMTGCNSCCRNRSGCPSFAGSRSNAPQRASRRPAPTCPIPAGGSCCPTGGCGTGNRSGYGSGYGYAQAGPAYPPPAYGRPNGNPYRSPYPSSYRARSATPQPAAASRPTVRLTHRAPADTLTLTTGWSEANHQEQTTKTGHPVTTECPVMRLGS